jgi:enterochelin esterase family protein
MRKIFLILFLLVSVSNSQVKYSFKSFTDFKFKLDSICNISDETFRNATISQLWDTLKAYKAIPFTFGDSVAFLYRASVTQVRWAGDFNGWNPDASGYSGRKVGLTSDVWLNIKNFPTKARLDYKIVTGSSNWIFDPANPYQQYSGVGTYNSELRMPNWTYPQETIRRPSVPQGLLSDNQFIFSSILGYNIYFKVYLPANYTNLNSLPVIYVTDGHEYSDDRLGTMLNTLDNLIYDQKIKPIIAVFIDPRSVPNSSGTNRRGQQYVNNSKFADFVANELVPLIDSNYKTNRSADARAILGTSLGGLNSAYFGYYRSDIFHLIGIHSPAFQAGTSIYSYYQNNPKLPLKIFMSTGTINDTQSYALQMKTILDSKGYQLMYIEVPEGHSWGNWRALIDEPLIYFFKDEIPTSMKLEKEVPAQIGFGNYPNPFNPSTKFWFSLPSSSEIKLEIFNLLGEKIESLISNELKDAGAHSVNFDASRYSSGIYLARLNLESFSVWSKIIYLK